MTYFTSCSYFKFLICATQVCVYIHNRKQYHEFCKCYRQWRTDEVWTPACLGHYWFWNHSVTCRLCYRLVVCRQFHQRLHPSIYYSAHICYHGSILLFATQGQYLNGNDKRPLNIAYDFHMQNTSRKYDMFLKHSQDQTNNTTLLHMLYKQIS